MKKGQTCENLQGAHGQDLYDTQLYCCLPDNDSMAIQKVRAASTSYVSSSLPIHNSGAGHVGGGRACLASYGLNTLQNKVRRVARVSVVFLELIQIGSQ